MTNGIKDIADGRSDLFRLNPDLIVIADGWNARDFEDPENQAHVRALADSIREVGVKEPLTVYMHDGQPTLTNGESRLRAVRLLQSEGVEIKTVPVQTEPKQASEADRLASQIIRNSGKQFSVLEMSSVFCRLLDYGWTEKDIASRGGMTVERVKQIVSINQAPAQTKAMVRKGLVSATVVQRVIAKSKSASEINEKVRAAVEKAKAEGKTKAGPRHVETAPREPKAPVVIELDVLKEARTLIQNGAVGTAIEKLAGSAQAKQAVALAVLKLALTLDADQRGAILDYLEAKGDDLGDFLEAPAEAGE